MMRGAPLQTQEERESGFEAMTHATGRLLDAILSLQHRHHPARGPLFSVVTKETGGEMNPLIVEMEKNAQIHKLDDEIERLREANARLRKALEAVKREFDSGRVNPKLGEIVNDALRTPA